MDAGMDAGTLRERVSVLALTGNAAEGWRWTVARNTWARAEPTGKKTVFSEYGTGTAGVTFWLRRQPLGPDSALRWNGQHCCIAAIVPVGRGHIKVTAALAEPVLCADRYQDPAVTFPGILLDPFQRKAEWGWEQLEPQAQNTLHRVLVTPKAVSLKPGRLVEVAGVKWPILTAHDSFHGRNEYELCREVDL